MGMSLDSCERWQQSVLARSETLEEDDDEHIPGNKQVPVTEWLYRIQWGRLIEPTTKS